MNNGYINGNVTIAGIGFPVKISAQDEQAQEQIEQTIELVDDLEALFEHG